MKNFEQINENAARDGGRLTMILLALWVHDVPWAADLHWLLLLPAAVSWAVTVLVEMLYGRGWCRTAQVGLAALIVAQATITLMVVCGAFA